MNRIAKLAIIFALITTAASRIEAQTNLDYWVENLNVSLSGATNGILVTNGIVARVKTAPVRLASKDLITALNNKPTFRLTTVVITNVVIETNIVHATNVFITNTTIQAVQVYTA